MKDYIKKVAVTVSIAILVIVAIILISLALYFILPYFLPFFIAYIMAVLLEPLNQLLMKIKMVKRPLAVSITFILTLGFITWLSLFTVTRITSEFFSLTHYIQKNIPSIQAWFVNTYDEFLKILNLLPPEIITQINKSFSTFTQKLANIDIVSYVGNYIISISTAIPNLFIIIIIIFVSLYLFSLYLPKIHKQFLNFFKAKSQRIINVLLDEMKKATIGFLRAQIILSTITYTISFISLTILGVKYAYLFALLIIIVDMLPILGTGSTLVPWGAFSIATGNVFLGVGLIVLFVVITIVRKAIEPKILGEKIGLGPLITLISIWVGFKALGIIGVFVGPLLVIFFRALVKVGVIQKNLKI
ncbi:MAG: sporulation integral membrane protein YtvI [Vulcanibacillus sp.]